jgi:hypothetical protein
LIGEDTLDRYISDPLVHHSPHAFGYNVLRSMGCRTNTSGAGVELGIRLSNYLDFVSDVSIQPQASPVTSMNIGGSLTRATFGIRSGYSNGRVALKASLSPGFASYSRTGAEGSAPKRNFNFAAVAAISTDIRMSAHLGFRTTLEQSLIRYKSPDRDPDGIGTPPRLSFLSHDNYINSTNWGVRVGPVIRF